ncbi:MAG: SdiA-regulated domain-containing protein [Spirochaetales bacterium]|nr:SdiA-regulated domain-containing protein [Spirochaetales bacterium]
MKIKLSIIFTLFIALTGFSQSAFPYDFSKMEKRIILPAVLNEVSGLTDIDLQYVACVQDEFGTVFVHDLQAGKIVATNRFDNQGDFEGLTYTGNAIYILRSDGRLTEWSDFSINGNSGKINNYKLSLPTSDNEGLAFDPDHNRLLISGKNKPDIKNKKNERYIYEFDISTKKLQDEPAFILDLDELENYITENNLELFTAKKKINFSPASLAIHPVTKHIYIISARDFLLLVIDQKGDLLYIEALNPELFPQAEGITFLKNGTMIITNEANSGVPSLLTFEML